MVLQTGDAALVPVQRPHELAGAGGPDLDGAVPARGDDILLVKVHNVHSRSESSQLYSTESSIISGVKCKSRAR